jgi:hypothetical protein
MQAAHALNLQRRLHTMLRMEFSIDGARFDSRDLPARTASSFRSSTRQPARPVQRIHIQLTCQTRQQ